MLKGEDTCTAPSRPLSIDDVNDLKMDGNVAVINACKGNNGFWAQLVDGDKWENIDAKVNQFTVDETGCNPYTHGVCVLIWDGSKFISKAYTTKEVEITVQTVSNKDPWAFFTYGGSTTTTQTVKVKVEGFCQTDGTSTVIPGTIPTGSECSWEPVGSSQSVAGCYPNADCVNGECVCKDGFELHNTATGEHILFSGFSKVLKKCLYSEEIILLGYVGYKKGTAEHSRDLH